jgi:hypothetical protein
LWAVAAVVVVGLLAIAKRKTNGWTVWVARILGAVAFVLTMQALVIELTDLLYLHRGQSID